MRDTPRTRNKMMATQCEPATYLENVIDSNPTHTQSIWGNAPKVFKWPMYYIKCLIR